MRRGPGANDAVLAASVSPLAVDHHAARDHDRPAEASLVQRTEQRRGAEIVVGDVGVDVGEVDAQPHHRRLVADRVDTLHCLPHRLEVPHIGIHVVDVIAQVVRMLGVRRRRDGVERDHVVAACDQRIHDV